MADARCFETMVTSWEENNKGVRVKEGAGCSLHVVNCFSTGRVKQSFKCCTAVIAETAGGRFNRIKIIICAAFLRLVEKPQTEKLKKKNTGGLVQIFGLSFTINYMRP